MKTVIKTTFKIILPFILIALAYFLYIKTNVMSEPQIDVIRLSPYVIFVIGAVISWKFNRSREFFILIIFTLCLVSLAYLPGTIDKSIQMADSYSIICLVIPINIALFSLFKERGILSLWGGIRIGMILSQILLSFWLIDSRQQEIFTLIKKDIFPVNLHSITSISQVSIIFFVIALVILILRQIKYKSSQDISFIAVLIALFFVLHQNSNPTLYSIFFAASGIVLIASIIQDSYSMAFSDELTGLPSRRALKQDMMKLGMNYVIAMLDIDHFKKFNDTYGHDTGDEVLKLVASTIKDVTGGGKSYRYGGEEFTILFPGKSVNDVLPHLEELREKISKRAFTLRNKRGKGKSRSKRKTRSARAGKQIYITVSIGVSQKNEKSKTPDAVMKSADTALYRAKKKGRNCVSK
ncbi:diguanylate cyclase (GGDEF) domain-containing protein [Fontibacillus panacisegetis]|uniref:Diguanylate cyclase (GGDEF) domain-containing protein n=1 Tax=Fontibacillus panacisegetis TaxID=670482 RepID=A0A1G7JBY9_9BACL|nr:GGDEF domain-containing protein [Fontibacillus panacisegetis]SDF22441.1 diguanylate cyclase (GGDEF) domain-containing protein [Fontibacillus panacisegetis]